MEPQIVTATVPIKSSSSSASYMPQLDGLRALAVLAVMLHHFGLPLKLDWILRVGWGELGVRLFFVLSGFLITGILLRARAEKSHLRAFGIFYARRALRIFPIFYLTLFVAAALNVHPVRETLGWHLSYLSNVLLAIRHGGLYPVTHFWSLAVEEQFYLLWPWLMLYLPDKLLLPMIGFVIFLAPASRVVGRLMGISHYSIDLLTPGCFDSLGMGAVLAMLKSDSEKPLRIPAMAGWLAVTLMAFVLFLRASFTHQELLNWIHYPVVSFAFVLVVAKAADGFRSWPGRLLNSKPLLYLGKISYGIYVYHLFCQVLGAWLLRHLFRDELFRNHVNIVLPYFLTIIVASLSWFMIESPINGLKRYLR